MKSKLINADSSRQEITRGIPGFPLTCYSSHFSNDTYDYIDWHWHIEFQLCIVTEGTVLWQIGPEQMTVPAGNGIFINSQQVHRVQPCQCSSASFFCADFRPDLFRGATDDTLYNEYVLPLLGNKSLPAKKISSEENNQREVLDRLKSMAAVFENKAACYEYELVGSIFQIYGKLFPLISKGSRPACARDARLREILVYIQSSYSQPLSLDDIAAHAGLSRSECCRYFKSQTGQTLFAYLIQYRISKSLELLTFTDKTISQIAQSVGFSSQSYYTDRFRTAIGTTPTEYRKHTLERCQTA